MSGRNGLRLWITGVLFAVLGALGALAWLAMRPAEGEREGSRTRESREAEALPSFETETSVAEPEALASPVMPAAVQPTVAGTTLPPAAGARAQPPAPSRRFAVSVVDTDGHAIPGALVQAFAERLPDDDQEVFRKAIEGQDPTRLTPAQLGRLVMRQQGASDPTWAEPLGTWTTDAVGAAFLDVPSDTVLLVAERAPEGCSGVVTIASAEKLEGAEPRPVLKLSPRGTLNGRVLTIDGSPAAGADVIFTSAHTPDDSRPRLPKPLVTDADGRFTVEVDTRFFAQVRAERDGASTVDEYAHVWPGRPGQIELRFPGAFGVDGVVRGPDGEALPWVSVGVAGYEVHADEATTDAQGQFHLALTRPCHVVVVAAAKDLVQSEVVAVTVSEEQPGAQVELRMESPSSISGVLLDVDGAPLAARMLHASAASPDFHDSTSPEMAAWHALGKDERAFRDSFRGFGTTDGEGRFRFEKLHAGFAYDLRAFEMGESPRKAELKAVLAGSQDVELRMPSVTPGADVLQGRVVDAGTRSPLSPCMVSAFDWSFGGAGFSRSHVDVDDADAHFRLIGLDPGVEYGLLVEVVNYPPAKFGPFKPSADEEHELAVGKAGALTVVVVDEDDVPQPGALVQLMDGEPRGFGVVFGQVETRTADSQGLVVWSGLKPSTCTLEAVNGTLRAPRVKVSVPPGRSLPVQLVVAKPEGTGRLEVCARRLDGSAWAGAHVKVVSIVEAENEAGDFDPVYLARTDENGILVFEGLRAGRYAASLVNSDVIVPIAHAEVGAEGSTSVVLMPRG